MNGNREHNGEDNGSSGKDKNLENSYKNHRCENKKGYKGCMDMEGWRILYIHNKGQRT